MDFSFKARVERMRAVERKILPVVHRHGAPAYKTNIKRNRRNVKRATIRENGYPWFTELLCAGGLMLVIWVYFMAVMSF